MLSMSPSAPMEERRCLLKLLGEPASLLATLLRYDVGEKVIVGGMLLQAFCVANSANNETIRKLLHSCMHASCGPLIFNITQQSPMPAAWACARCIRVVAPPSA